MSVVNDATRHARDVVDAAEGRVARLEGQLAAIPGWLRVGDPGRHGEPADHAAAVGAVALGAWLDRARRAAGQLRDRLEQTVGMPPSSTWSFLAYSDWLAALPADDPQRLLDELVTSPERLLTEAGAMSAAKAQAILDYVAGNGGRVGDGQVFRVGVPLDDVDLADLDATGVRLRAGAPPAVGWDVLLPVRLETRFVPPDPEAPAGDPEAGWRLKVRVEPDAPSLARQPGPVSARDAELVAICWTEAGGDLASDLGEAAHRKLAAAVGGGRAGYLLRTVPVSRTDTGFVAADAYSERPAPLTAPVVGLPTTLEIWGGPAEAPQRLLTLVPDLATIARDADLQRAAKPVADETPRLWWNSYAAAAQVGLAGEIALGPERPDLEVLLCLGYDDPNSPDLSDRKAGSLFAGHADTGRVEPLAPLTPTTTLAGSPTTDLGSDPAPWLQAVHDAPGELGGLAAVLLGQSSWPGVPRADDALPRTATVLTRALWPVLWQRTLKDVAGGGEEIWGLGEWAGRHLHPFGPYPVLRFGDLPYGVLPVADYDRWVWRAPLDRVRAGDPRAEQVTLAGLPVLDVPLLAAALAQPTAAGADAGGLLEVFEHVPASRAYGSRALPPTLLYAALRASIPGGASAAQILQEWEEQFASVRRSWPPGPTRLYSPLLNVEPWPERVDPDYRELLKVYLDSTWVRLAEERDESNAWRLQDDSPPAVLARLVRHALVLTQAEVARLNAAGAAPSDAAMMFRLDRIDELFRLASGGTIQDVGRVSEVPQSARNRVAVSGADPRAAVVVRQFEDVRTAVEQLLDPEPELVERVLPAVLDLTGHRTDAWWTGLADRRLRTLVTAGGRPRLGCYGWVDDLQPNADSTPPTTAGLLHAPGYTQAVTAAVLRDQAVHHPADSQWDLTLSSASVRAAAALAEQVRSGVHLSEALGREIERRVGDPATVLLLRDRYPARPEWAGRRVCDGQQVLDAGDLPPGVEALLSDLRVALDAYADLLVADALHDLVEGRMAAAQESLEASAGLGAPPEMRLLRTQRSGSTVKTTVRVGLPWSPGQADPAQADPRSPVAVGDPALAALLAAELGSAADWTWEGPAGPTSLADLGLGVADAVMLPAAAVGGTADDSPAATRYLRLQALCGLVAGAELDPSAAPMLRERLARLRALAADLQAELAAPLADTAALCGAWGLPEDPGPALQGLTERLAQLGDDDATAGVGTLAEWIRALLPSVLGLSLACPTQAVPTTEPVEDPAGWLEIVAAVRPAMARLELVQLTLDRPWPATASDADPLWQPGDLTTSAHRDLTLTFDAGGAAPDRLLVTADVWAETVPSRRHSTWAAFGYDAPRARPPQAILVVVPPDHDAPDQVPDILGAVLRTRRMARLRSIRQPLPPEVGQLLPTALLVDPVTPAGATLLEER